jgi:hypothetical protein
VSNQRNFNVSHQTSCEVGDRRLPNLQAHEHPKLNITTASPESAAPSLIQSVEICNLTKLYGALIRRGAAVVLPRFPWVERECSVSQRCVQTLMFLDPVLGRAQNPDRHHVTERTYEGTQTVAQWTTWPRSAVNFKPLTPSPIATAIGQASSPATTPGLGTGPWSSVVIVSSQATQNNVARSPS